MAISKIREQKDGSGKRRKRCNPHRKSMHAFVAKTLRPYAGVAGPQYAGLAPTWKSAQRISGTSPSTPIARNARKIQR
jgi:hypothetical protein